ANSPILMSSCANAEAAASEKRASRTGTRVSLIMVLDWMVRGGESRACYGVAPRFSTANPRHAGFTSSSRLRETREQSRIPHRPTHAGGVHPDPWCGNHWMFDFGCSAAVSLAPPPFTFESPGGWARRRELPWDSNPPRNALHTRAP